MYSSLWGVKEWLAIGGASGTKDGHTQVSTPGHLLCSPSGMQGGQGTSAEAGLCGTLRPGLAAGLIPEGDVESMRYLSSQSAPYLCITHSRTLVSTDMLPTTAADSFCTRRARHRAQGRGNVANWPHSKDLQMLERQIHAENMGWNRTCNIKEMDSTRSTPDGEMARGCAGTKRDILCRGTTAQTNLARTCVCRSLSQWVAGQGSQRHRLGKSHWSF